MAIKYIIDSLLYGAAKGYSHYIIYCDHFDYTPGYRYVKEGENINDAIHDICKWGSIGMYTIDAIYNFNMSLADQLQESSPYHKESPKTKINYKESNTWCYLLNKVITKEKGEYISEKLIRAIEYAFEKHDGQLRKNNVPYINHPMRVALLVAQNKDTNITQTSMIAACLHDVVENTDTSIEEIGKIFGTEVALLVSQLTTNKLLKKELGKQRVLEIEMCSMTNEALNIKLCDRLDNVKDLSNCKEEFIIYYIDETKGILNYLLDNRELTKTHFNIIEQIICALASLCEDDKERLREIDKIGNLLLKQRNKKATIESPILGLPNSTISAIELANLILKKTNSADIEAARVFKMITSK